MPIHSRKRCHQLLGFGGVGGAAGGVLVFDGVALVAVRMAFVGVVGVFVSAAAAFVGDVPGLSAPASSEVSVPERPGEESPFDFREPVGLSGRFFVVASSLIGGGVVK